MGLGDIQKTISLKPPITEIVHYVNDSHIITCDGHNTTTVQWFNQKNNLVKDRKGRIHTEEMSPGSLTLVFEHITLSDKGNWTCKGDADDLAISFKMVVNKPISFMDTPVIQTAREDFDATIRCEVKGDPEPSISWYYNGKLLNLPSRKYTKLADGLLIKKISRNDSGEYTCKAFQVSTTISNVQEQTIRLNVEHKPFDPLLRKPGGELTFGYMHGIVNLTCIAEAEPHANFSWYRNQKKLNPKIHLIYTEYHESKLQVVVNSTSVFGKYLCKAQNVIGTLEKTIILAEGTKPNRPTKLELRGLNSDTFDIDIGATRTYTNHSEMEVNGYRFEIIALDEFKSNGGKWDKARVLKFGFEDGITYLINNLSPNTTYYIRVAASNKAGLSDWIGPKEFRTKPQGLTMRNSARNNLTTSLFTYFIIFLIVNLINNTFLNRHHFTIRSYLINCLN